jgi:hypothetical protein
LLARAVPLEPCLQPGRMFLIFPLKQVLRPSGERVPIPGEREPPVGGHRDTEKNLRKLALLS